MDKRQTILVEWELFRTVRAFLECVEDKEQRNKMVKKAIFEFNEQYGTTTEEVIEKLRKMLKETQAEELKEMKIEDGNNQEL